ncbi:hypothetical protein JTE90_002671 [Oedothorax gibbosus]|uniref:Uncharacterized protein n=1 Tax=Oedothorax gibbosus TaxID=931172 RepID=A0AAV6U082_9ARAC|nr:hypothetical protein JTE90_002671 [Oedothorax gibbosus]
MVKITMNQQHEKHCRPCLSTPPPTSSQEFDTRRCALVKRSPPLKHCQGESHRGPKHVTHRVESVSVGGGPGSQLRGGKSSEITANGNAPPSLTSGAGGQWRRVGGGCREGACIRGTFD